ncbi:hypothetical protein S245_071381, partial [Arachis hypogaea]
MDRASVVGDVIEYIRELLRTERCKRQKAKDDAAESCNIKSFSNPDGCIRTWLQRKSKDSEVDVRIVDDDVTIKLFQRKKINCLLSVAKFLDELQLELHHVAGGHVGKYYSFLFNSKIIEGSSVYASAIANSVIDSSLSTGDVVCSHSSFEGQCSLLVVDLLLPIHASALSIVLLVAWSPSPSSFCPSADTAQREGLV